MTRFSNLVPLKSQRSYLGAPDYLMGYITITELYHWEVMGLLSVLSKKSWIYIGKCVILEIFSRFDNLMKEN